MKLTEQQEIKKRLIDLLSDYNAKYFSYQEVDYITEIVEQITDESDLGVIKKHFMNLYDATSDRFLIESIKKIVYEMGDIIEVQNIDEVTGKIIELSNNIKLNKLVTELVYDYYNNGAEVVIDLVFKNKFTIIKWITDEEKGIHICTNLDLYIYDNTVDLINKLSLVVGESR